MMFFEPYKGDQYEKGFCNGLKLLVLGESHYHPGYEPRVHDVPSFSRPYTRDVVDQFLALDSGAHFNKNFFGRLHRLLSGVDEPTETQARAAWSKIAFANYIQKFVGDGAAAAKRATHWASGEEALPGLLDRLTPDRVLVLGKGTWNHLSDGEWLEDSWSAGGSVRGLWGLPSQGRLVPATWVYHPAWGRDIVQIMREVLHALMSIDGANS